MEHIAISGCSLVTLLTRMLFLEATVGDSPVSMQYPVPPPFFVSLSSPESGVGWGIGDSFWVHTLATPLWAS